MSNEHLEWRKSTQVNEILAKEQRCNMDDFLGYYSSWYALQKGVTWLLRFLTFLRLRQMDRSRLMAKQLSVAEIRVATERIVKYLQQQHFSEKIKVLEERSEGSSKNRKGGIPKGSKLEKLSPILTDGILESLRLTTRCAKTLQGTGK